MLEHLVGGGDDLGVHLVGALGLDERGDLLDRVDRTIIRPVLETMRNEGVPYVGVLYAGLVLTDSVPTVSEFYYETAATETQVWVSFDDGDHWHTLRLNMPAVSVRDIQVKDDSTCLYHRPIIVSAKWCWHLGRLQT